MAVRFGILAVLGLATIPVVLPLVGDPNTVTWLGLAVLVAFGVPISAWASVRLLWPSKSQASMWIAFAAALVSMVGLVLAAFVVGDLGPRDIGTAVGRVARQEGMLPGGVRAGAVVSKLGFRWAKVVGSPHQDDVHALTFGDDGLRYAAGAFHAAAGAAPGGEPVGGELFVVGFAEDGEVKRRHVFKYESQARVQSIAADDEGTLHVVVRTDGRVFAGAKTYGALGARHTLLATLDAGGNITKVVDLACWGLATLDGQKNWVLFARQSGPIDLGGVLVVANKSPLLLRIAGDGKLLGSRVLAGDHAEIVGLSAASDAIYVAVALKAVGDDVDFGIAKATAGRSPVTWVAKLNPELATEWAKEAAQKATLIGPAFQTNPDGELWATFVVDDSVPASSPPGAGGGASAPTADDVTSVFNTPVVVPAGQRLKMASMVVVRLSKAGQEQARLVLGPPLEATSVDRGFPVAGWASTNGLVLVSAHTQGLRAGGFSLPPTAANDVNAWALAVGADGAATTLQQFGGKNHEQLLVVTGRGREALVGGVFAGEADFGGFVLPPVQDPNVPAGAGGDKKNPRSAHDSVVGFLQLD